MARKPRTARTGRAATAPSAPADELAPQAESASARARPARQVSRLSPGTARVVDYSYVAHDVMRIAVITVLLIGGMVALSMNMR